ncbi:hypothetical protein PaG_03087 [Moesziomyces aphidis]|uniref:Uncharacterized protein n=1 Tax=Moesziomyces aphidis TaxID=84754 RepID=W3VNV6_MOEAP|nr:hypothetical protein PaG_03087 [Moesziomyces aphidis]
MPKRAASRDERAGRGVGAARSTETNTERQFGSAPKKSGRTSRGKRLLQPRPSALSRRLARYQQPSAPPVQTSPPIHRSNSRPRSSYRKLMHARATGVQHHPGLASLMARHAQTSAALAYTRDCLAPISAADAISAAVQHAMLAS